MNLEGVIKAEFSEEVAISDFVNFGSTIDCQVKDSEGNILESMVEKIETVN